MHDVARTAALVFALVVAGCGQPQAPPSPQEPPDTRAADEAAIHALVKEWSASAQAKDAAKFATFYADDAILMLEDAPDASGMAAIRETTLGLMSDPSFALSFVADKVTVARAGDLAYETGTYSLTVTGADKKPATEKGHYVVVWRKQAGTWKVVLDAPVSDPS